MGEGFWFGVATDAGALVFAGQQQPATLSEFSFSVREKVAARPDEGEHLKIYYLPITLYQSQPGLP